MTATVHHLTEAGPITEPVKSVIDELEELLARAKAGEIKGIGFFVVNGGDGVATWWETGCASEAHMICGVSTLFHRVMRAATD